MTKSYLFCLERYATAAMRDCHSDTVAKVKIEARKNDSKNIPNNTAMIRLKNTTISKFFYVRQKARDYNDADETNTN